MAAPSAVRPMPGTANTVSTATAPPVSPTATIPNCGTRGGSTRRRAAAEMRVLLTPAPRHSSTQRSSSTGGSASATSRPSSPPAGTPSATAGSTMYCGPCQPEVGRTPSHTPHTSNATVASRNSGSAASMAANAPAEPRPRTRTGATIAQVTRSATPSAAPISASDTWSPETTDGRTSVPDTQDVPRSPRGRRESQLPSRERGPASRPRSERIAARASGVPSCSAERARRTVRAGSRPESQGSSPTAARTAARQPSRVSEARRPGANRRAMNVT